MNYSAKARAYQAAPSLLAGKVIAITGAGAGIGRAAALSYAQHGATVLLIGRTLAKLETIYDEIEAAGGNKPAIFPINLESAVEQDYIAMQRIFASEFGHLDGLLHNAGELGPRAPIRNYPLESWQKILQINVTAPFLMTQNLLPLLEKSASASIIFTGASVGIKGDAYWGAYAAAKAATHNLMQTLTEEVDGLGKIRVNAIDPGPTRTGIRAQAYPAEDPSTVTAAMNIMNTYLFLMGDESMTVTGQLLQAQEKR